MSTLSETFKKGLKKNAAMPIGQAIRPVERGMMSLESKLNLPQKIVAISAMGIGGTSGILNLSDRHERKKQERKMQDLRHRLIMQNALKRQGRYRKGLLGLKTPRFQASHPARLPKLPEAELEGPDMVDAVDLFEEAQTPLRMNTTTNIMGSEIF